MPSGKDYLDFLIGQRQTREFTSDPVGDTDIQALLETMQYTGSASNKQPWQFLVVRTPNRSQCTNSDNGLRPPSLAGRAVAAGWPTATAL